MRSILVGSLLCSILASPALAQAPEPPLDDTRLTIHTLVREDVFAGWRSDNQQRLERAEKNIERLLTSRPAERADLLAWKGGIAVYRAANALESEDQDAFEKYYQTAQELFAAAKQANPNSGGVMSIAGGSYAQFADQLPEPLRTQAWQASYESFRRLEKQQSEFIDKLPTHMRGELLAGLAQSSLRTGRVEQYNEYLDKIIEMLPQTAYSRAARR